MFAIDFPPVSHVIEWPEFFFEGTPFAVNKVVFLMWLSALISVGFVIMAGRNFKLVPRPLQNVGESFYGFIQNGIILETMGPDGLKYTLVPAVRCSSSSSAATSGGSSRSPRCR